MTQLTAEQVRTRAGSLLIAFLAAALVVLAAATTSACGSSGPSAGTTASPIKTAIIKVLPRDASQEPPWNGRFVQVNARVARPAAMDPADWHVFVNGKEPKLDAAPNILPYSSTEAVVAFLFQTPCADPGTYQFRVVYAPKDAEKVQLAWDYTW